MESGRDLKLVRQEYIAGLEMLSGQFIDRQKSSIYITGSYASGSPTPASDMDIHTVIGQALPPFEVARSYLEAELSLRERIQNNAFLESLSRHPNSLFSTESYQLHLISLPWRYGLPLQHGEHYLAFGAPVEFVGVSDRDLLADLIVSVGERLGKYRVNGDTKWLALNQRDLQYFTTGTSFGGDRALPGSPDEIAAAQHSRAEELGVAYDVRNTELERRSILHALTWTAEKVVWELLFCSRDKDYFDLYRRSLTQRFGFTPFQTGALVDKVVEHTRVDTDFKTQNLRSALDRISGADIEMATEAIGDLYVVLGQWTESAIRDVLELESFAG